MVIMNILAKTFVSLCSACQSTVSSVCDSILECGKLQTLQCNAMCAVVRPCCFCGPAVVKPAHQTALHGCHIMCKSYCLQHLSQAAPPPPPPPILAASNFAAQQAESRFASFEPGFSSTAAWHEDKGMSGSDRLQAAPPAEALALHASSHK